MNNFIIILFFLVMKGLQLFNYFTLSQLLGNKEEIPIIIGVFVSAMVIFSINYFKFNSTFSKIIEVIFTTVIIISFVLIAKINPFWLFVIFLGVFLYMTIAYEGQILRSFSNNKITINPLQYLITLIPVIIFIIFTEKNNFAPIILYIVCSIFAYISAYRAIKHNELVKVERDDGQKIHPIKSLLTGIVIIFFGLSLNLFIPEFSQAGGENTAKYLIVISLLAYQVGAICIYYFIEEILNNKKLHPNNSLNRQSLQ